VNKGCANLQIRPSTVKELQGLQEGPAIPFHDKSSQGTCRPALSPHRMHEDTLGCLICLLDEFIYGVCCLIFDIKDNLKGNHHHSNPLTYLIVLIEPEECEIGHPDGLPVVWDLLTCAVDDVGDLVCHHELQVLLCNILITVLAEEDGLTCAANSSPMNRPSLILMAPIMS